MKQEEIIGGLAQLGAVMRALGTETEYAGFELGITEKEWNDLQYVINRQVAYNGWFTKENVRQSLKALGDLLTKEKLNEWTSKYTFSEEPKRIGIIMAGNIPLVGFHDFLSVIVSGNKAVCKLSSDDKTLLPAIAGVLIQFLPEIANRIEFVVGKIGELDGVIATGSNNSLKYFEQYFGKYPHIFRKNRTSIAVLSGDETPAEIEALGNDIFSYFGLGCRNVSHLMFPADFKVDRFFEGIFSHSEVINNNKYGNNYDYNKAVYLMNQHKLLDNNFVLLRESEELFSPLAMLHYQFYNSSEEVTKFIDSNKEDIQVVVGKNYLPFGQAQQPGLFDYADGVDIMLWLSSL